MSRSRESGAYLGGIGTMLGDTRACTVCGGVHETHPYGLQHRGAGQCPLVVQDEFAVVSLSDGRLQIEETPTIEPGIPLRTPLPLSLGGLPLPPRENESRSARHVEVPWLPPPDLSEVA
ncbi:MAG TPA: hypothetical protein VN842_00320 [Thermoplasmata archaeon]|nr:hypothetical protein [Thermoplasmata archaeon]